MKKIKVGLLVISILAIIATLILQGSLAYFTVTGIAENVITFGNIKMKIVETTTGGEPFPEDGVHVIPGETVDKAVTIENVCEQPFYLRVKVVGGIKGQEVPAEDLFEIVINDTNWVARDDGYIYYNRVLQPHEVTEPVFSEVKIVGDKVDNSFIGKTLTVTVKGYAVQAKNNPADLTWEASGWPADDQ
ncbi:MAG: hypothetical protein II748_02155 [Clostridia bacterium]|nr:hypothetical protein [Clostridia bacterium]